MGIALKSMLCKALSPASGRLERKRDAIDERAQFSWRHSVIGSIGRHACLLDAGDVQPKIVGIPEG